MTTKKQFELKQHSFEWEGKTMSFETGKLAMQAGSSIRLQLGENVLLFTTCIDNNPRPGTDFLPLMIDYRESYSAAGRIAGAVYRRREAKACEAATLYARMADRALRPMFPKGMINSIVISITPLSFDQKMEMDVATIVGSSLSVMAAGLPFDGPVGAVQIGYIEDKYIINPTKAELELSLFNLLLAGKKGSINMIECGAKEVPENILQEAFEIGQKEIDKICDIQSEFLSKLDIQTQEVIFNKPSESVIAYISNILTEDKLNALTGNTKVPFNNLFNQYNDEVLELCHEKIENAEEPDFTESSVKMGVFHVVKYFIRNRTIETKKRLDDRGELDIRSLYCEVGNIPRVHGTGLFWRGDTQVMTTTTLGGPKDYLIYDDMENDGTKQRYFHHYNFPPFSVGEANTIRYVGRREIGHGKLAEKALMPMIPSKEEFPYSIRTVSECLGSGGSTSMGSVCGSTLSLMDAGVPIKKPVAGIAMGLMTKLDDNENIEKYSILNDLQGTEDFTGDMDFKVAGTRDGVTAIQLDTKLKGLPMNIIHETITRSIAGYNEIMDFMLETIAKPNDRVKEYAPKIFIIKVAVDKIKEVIGKGGDVINKIIEDCDGIKIDFDDDGTCYLTHPDQAMIDKATAIIKEIVTDLEVGQEFDAKITRVEDYGLFVQLPKNKLGLCHISNLGQRYETPLTNHFKIGTNIRVKIKSIDHDGKIAVLKI
ncbi:polyribonucleotide nucleotidyltransferase [Candidatus Gracilibacteria bacterium]|nr:polyribonucleotide nucleotidyltransferase [Candidatus Gracilibacteria bacterium]